MTSNEIRQTFLNYFKKKEHKIVDSAPLVMKNDPTLMFTNAGMNQFKDYFLNNKKAPDPRVADTQKCLRVSGKHNDLEDVGLDSYHHTLFEMLGNWSFGDYFKEEAINMAWELMTEVYGIDPERLYVTIFGGDAEDGLHEDDETYGYWEKHVAPERILRGDKKDNFWEMGDQGPCGPCSEIHMDIRSDEERKKLSGDQLVNQDHPLVIELWNLVFIQFNRLADGSLEELPAKHIDTGMGLERLAMVLQNKKSNYETDLFSGLIEQIETLSGKKYSNSYDDKAKKDIAFRVMSDHIRAVCFGIADGEMPSNTGAGYVLRRILRRAIRYGYSFLGFRTPALHKLIPQLADDFKDVFPEVKQQAEFIAKVILEEEKSFLKTLEDGLEKLEQLSAQSKNISGQSAFELYDTFGFPIDLTQLIAREKGLKVDMPGFHKALEQQKQRSRADSNRQLSDWTIVEEQKESPKFIGYDQLHADDAQLLRYRKISDKSGEYYQLVFSETPFYAESGGQVGDKGWLSADGERIEVLDTIKENDLILHIAERLPDGRSDRVELSVDATRRRDAERNHTATHLLHAALRQILGDHVVQKGSLVAPNYLRFDFSHFEKISEEQLEHIESLVNQKIRENIPLKEQRAIPMEQARQEGALMLFGEKYGDEVRVITFDGDYSKELCGGCHVSSTGVISFFKIIQETSVSSGVRRIEALTGRHAEQWIREKTRELQEIQRMLKSSGQVKDQIRQILKDNKELKKEIDRLKEKAASGKAGELKSKSVEQNGVHFLLEKIELSHAKQLKSMLFELEKQLNPAVIFLAASSGEKAQLGLIISRKILAEKDWHAGQLIKEWASIIEGGGGGQDFFAVAGGKEISGLEKAVETARNHFLN